MGRMLLLVVTLSAGLLLAGLWIPFKAVVAQELLTMAWARTQASQVESRPWPWADTWPVARLQLPGEESALVVLSGGHGESLAFGPGQVRGPDLGERPRSPVVVAGHRDTHFRPLKDIKQGQEIRLQFADGAWRRYRVDSLRIVDSRQEQMDLTRYDRNSLVLVTCYPFDSLDANGPLRFVVEASRDMAWPTGGQAAVGA
ncbi:class GN sortase [Marinobacter lacisalsi]|uniref:Class GN sortase n=1 Tax=Marinobacter lacisalsi TaxID=475979 RepID=A0ABV8QI31_9GAMM